MPENIQSNKSTCIDYQLFKAIPLIDMPFSRDMSNLKDLRSFKEWQEKVFDWYTVNKVSFAIFWPDAHPTRSILSLA